MAGQPDGCAVRLVEPSDVERDDGSEGFQVLQMPSRVLPCRTLDEAELASMIGIHGVLIMQFEW